MVIIESPFLLLHSIEITKQLSLTVMQHTLPKAHFEHTNAVKII